MRTPIAIVGRGCVLPGATDPDGFWIKLQSGQDLLTRPPDGAWPVSSEFVTFDSKGRRWSDRGGYVAGLQFDPSGFAIDADEVLQADRVAHWVLHASRTALNEAGHDIRQSHRRTGAILGHLSLPLPSQACLAVGVWLRQWANAQGRPELADAVVPTMPAPHNRYMSAMPTRLLTRALGLGSAAFTLDAACASSLYAIKLACDALEDRSADLMLAGAACGADPMFLHLGFRALNALSPTGQSRPFHRHANGLVPSEGAVVLALKRLIDAESAGDRILGVIRGVGLSNDGGAAGLLVPSSGGQERAMRHALNDANLPPNDVAMLECHATGTPIGDDVELTSIRRVYGVCEGLPIGSLKSQMGHLLAASGGASILKVLAGFKFNRMPSSLPVDDPMEALSHSPTRLLSTDEPWPASARRLAGINSFGFGGNNAHLLLEAHDERSSVRSIPKIKAPAVPVAVIGLGVMCAGAGNSSEFFRTLRSGTDVLQDDPRWGRCGLLKPFDLAHDQIRFPPNDLSVSQSQQVVLLKAACEALASFSVVPSNRTGVFVGLECDPEVSRYLARSMVPAWVDTWRRRFKLDVDKDWEARMSDGFAQPLRAASVTGSLLNIGANRINAHFRLGGPGFALSADELSGLRALEIATRELRHGELDLAIVAAADLSCEPVSFHAAADLQGGGRLPAGDAAVALVLKRLPDAQRDGDAVIAILASEIQQDERPGTLACAALQLGDAHGALNLGKRYGHAHAASGLLHIAAAVIACQHGVWLTPGQAEPWAASSSNRRVRISIRSLEGQKVNAEVRGATDAAPVSEVAASNRHGLPRGIRFEPHMPEVNLPALPCRTQRLSTSSGVVRTTASIAISPPSESSMNTFNPCVPLLREADYKKPLWSRVDLEEMTHCRLSRFFGKVFEPQDRNERQARLPSPPMLLLDRVISMEGRPGARESGRIVSETDITPGAWYLCDGFMPASLEVEAAGQGSILLISYLGADLLNGTERAFRMLDIEVTYHSERRPTAGDTLRFELEITGCAVAGDSLIFSFQCDSYLNEKPHFTVVSGKAGLFPPEELGSSPGILWSPENEVLDKTIEHHDAAATHETRSFDIDQVRAFYRGNLHECFGGESRSRLLRSPPTRGRDQRMQWIEEVPILDPRGGPWRRGYLMATYQLRGDEWIFKSHFKNDPTLPAWVMCDAGLQMIRFYATALGYLDNCERRDLIPVPSRCFKVMLRADTPPDPGEMKCEVFIRGIEGLESPTIWSDVVLSIRGRKTFLGKNFGFRVSSSPRPAQSNETGNQAAPVPLWSRADLEEMSHGKLSKFFGPQFETQDLYARQVRMPMPPLLLADRVMEIQGQAGSMGLGRIVTETDVTANAWYLHEGSMPAGLEVEAGQADLLLISYLGADLLNRGERVYRLLGCEMTYHGERRPRIGDKLRYEIEVTGHVNTGGIRLFFFRYDSYLNGELRLSVRNGRAGFFTSSELENAGGVLWDPLKDSPDPSLRHTPVWPSEGPRDFNRHQVSAFARGDAYECFGTGFENLASHHRTPRIQEGRMQLFEEVRALDPKGGPWGRGYLCATRQIAGDEWFFPGHFHNDPTMPGTLMCEAGIQLMSFYLAACGQTMDRDGWTFELVPQSTFTATCRGQVTPDSRTMTYELLVRSFDVVDYPTLCADVLLTVDGRKAFHGRNLCIRLWPAVPLAHAAPNAAAPGARPPVQIENFIFDSAAMLQCATGLPSLGFGSLFRTFDGIRNLTRLPSPPYHFMSRVTRLEGALGEMQIGSVVEAEYDIPDQAWYFDDNDGRTMPHAVLLEAALQPCGWLATYMGVPLQCASDLKFRNLDGDATLFRPIFKGDRILRTSARCTSISRNGDTFIESFQVECHIDETLAYSLKTVFGHFTATDLMAQKGLPASISECEAMRSYEGQAIDLTAPETSRQPLRMARGQLLMLDRITGYWPEGGAARRGRLLGHFAVNPRAWFFKAHFYRDPVQPGSLGIEAMIQLLQYYLLLRGHAEGMKQPRIEPLAVGRPMTWKFRGQVLPVNGQVSVELEIDDEGRDSNGPWVTAHAWLWVDGLRIYQAKGLSARIVEGGDQ